MQRLIDKSFASGPDQRFRVVALDDAIDILQQDQVKLNHYVERNVELEHENRRLREEIEQAHSVTLRIIQGYHHLKKMVQHHAPHILEYKHRRS